jgi:hypothetical protein
MERDEAPEVHEGDDAEVHGDDLEIEEVEVHGTDEESDE